MDLTNRRFGRLVVIRRESVSRATWNKLKQPTWFCECDCGEMVYVLDGNLRQGRTKSCGCLRKEKSKETAGKNFKYKPKEDLTGQTFGRLTVLRRSEKTSANRLPTWVTQCDCGNVHEVRADHLKQGKVKSCGCLRKRRDIATSPDMPPPGSPYTTCVLEEGKVDKNANPT